MFGPDFSSDEEGFSDDNDYYEFKKRTRTLKNEIRQSEAESEAEKAKKRLQSIFSIVSYGKYDVLVKELDAGLDANIELEYKWTPLLLAATVANEKIIAELLKRGANINHTRETFTALMYLCNILTDDEIFTEDILACIKLLVNHGADVNIIDNKRRNALMLAAYNGHLKAVQLLLPISNKEAEDNQRWTVLFWAVSGNRVQIVDFLLKEGFDCDKTDIRGNTIADIAKLNDFEDILNLLPKDPCSEEFYLHYLNNNHFSFEDTFANLRKNEKPQFVNDVCRILYGTRSESVIPLFLDNDVSFSEFLSLTDSKLKDIGLQLPYQRNRILGGLFRFHKHPFQPKSIPFIRKNDIYTNIDVSSTVLSCIKQLIAMEASLRFIMNNREGKLSCEESKDVEITLRRIRSQVKRLRLLTKQFVKQTELWDLTLRPVDKITRNRWNIPWANVCLTVGVLSLVAVFVKVKN